MRLCVCVCTREIASRVKLATSDMHPSELLLTVRCSVSLGEKERETERAFVCVCE